MAKKHATPPQHKHIPLRSCASCRTKADKRALVRLVRTDAGVEIDLSGKMSGRGAYLCRNRNCWERAASSNLLNKTLRMTLSDEDRKRLQQATPSS